MGSYYRRFAIQVYKQVRDFGREQSVGLILTILILMSQLHYGVITKEALRSDTLSIFWPYLAVLAGYLAIQVVRAPVVLDRQRSQKIAEKAGEIARLSDENRELKNPKKNVVWEFQRLTFGFRTNTPQITVYAKVLNNGPKTTLHQIRLTADATSLTPFQNGFMRREVDEIRLDPGDVQTSFLEFNGEGIERDWILKFSDHRGVAWHEPIPKTLYQQQPIAVC